MARSFALLVLAAPLAVPAADAPKPDDFVTVQKGTLPVVISAPHGGPKAVPGVPERVGRGVAKFATVLDANTAELVERCAARLEADTKGKPWLVIARFSRKHIDANRPRDGAYETDRAAPFYDVYHGALAAACKAVRDQFGRGLLLDVHGQGDYPDAICRGTQNLKTVTLLKDREGRAAVRGKRSVLGRMQSLGYAVLPEGDEKEVPQFAGGHTVGTYGSHTPFAIDAIQLEFGSRLRAREKVADTAADLADAVRTFYEAYLKDDQ